MRAASLLLATLSALLSGCVLIAAASAGKDPIATYRRVGDRYLIEVTGTRVGVSHDLSKHESYKDSWQFEVPRIEGRIEGCEIPRPPKTYPFVGSITIRKGRMIVDLKLDKYDLNHREDPIDWNGSYTLVEEKSSKP